MKKYLRVACSVCKRFADRLVDNTHYTPDKCTITFKCEGRLFPVEYRSDGGITAIPEVGVVDWIPRNSSRTSSPSAEEITFIDTSTGKKNQIVLAVATATVPASNSTLTLTLNQRVDTPKAFRQYVFRFETSFSTVSGVESGLEKKTLRYSVTDYVQVFLNGVKLEQGTNPDQYTIFDGTPTSVPNTIVFNSTIALPGVTQVDVIVSAVPTTTQVQLIFNRSINDESRKGTGSWENVDFVERFNGTTWVPYYLFRMDLEDGTALVLNTVLTSTSSVQISGIGTVSSTLVEMLLAHQTYSSLDRYLNLSVPLTTLSFDRDFLKYFAVDGSPVMYVTSTAVEAVFPLFRASKFAVEPTIQKAVQGDTNQIVVDGNVIVGPDA